MKRIHLIVAAVVLAAAFMAPSAAFAGKAHFLGMYKVEKQVDVQGEGEDYTISCKSGDIALDGMWRIDNVDQDNDYTPSSPPGWDTTGNHGFDVLESVLPVTSQSSGIGSFTFHFLPLAGGDTQGKIFLTCLPDPTPAIDGHSHHWTISNLFTATHPYTTPGGKTIDDSANANACPSTAIAVVPGFDWTAGNGVAYRRWPHTTSGITTWDWSFDVDSAASVGTPSSVTTSWRCLDYKTQTAGSPSHTHKFVKTFAPKSPSPGTGQTAKKNRVQELQVSCGELYKGMIGAWDFRGSYGFNKLWFLGMDPRPKTRAYKVLNADPSNNYTADFGLVCFKDKTT
jgi:hypothetical protein